MYNTDIATLCLIKKEDKTAPEEGFSYSSAIIGLNCKRINFLNFLLNAIGMY